MIYIDKEYGLEVWGDLACFTRPELKVERVSYDVITPSAARNIFQSIFWKPAIQWRITRIEVLNPIKHFSIRRNEVGAIGGGKADAPPIIAADKRQQKNSLMLRDVVKVSIRMLRMQMRILPNINPCLNGERQRGNASICRISARGNVLRILVFSLTIVKMGRIYFRNQSTSA